MHTLNMFRPSSTPYPETPSSKKRKRKHSHTIHPNNLPKIQKKKTKRAKKKKKDSNFWETSLTGRFTYSQQIENLPSKRQRQKSIRYTQ